MASPTLCLNPGAGRTRRGYSCASAWPIQCLHARLCPYDRKRAPGRRPSRCEGGRDGAHLDGRAVRERYDLVFQPWLEAGADPLSCYAARAQKIFRHGNWLVAGEAITVDALRIWLDYCSEARRVQNTAEARSKETVCRQPNSITSTFAPD